MKTIDDKVLKERNTETLYKMQLWYLDHYEIMQEFKQPKQMCEQYFINIVHADKVYGK